MNGFRTRNWNLCVPVVGSAALLWLGVGCASTGTIEPRADRILRQMSDKLAGTTAFSVDARVTRDELMPGGPMVEFTASHKITLRRPNQLHTISTGDGRDREVWFSDGMLAMLDREQRSYATLNTSRKIDDMLDDLQDEYDLPLPAADVLFSNPYSVLTENTISGQYVGMNSVGGQKCHHLAFRKESIDWQIWISADRDTLPRKLVISFLDLSGQPQTHVEFTNWDLSPRLAAGQFTFRAPAGVRRVEMENLFAALERN